MASPQSSDLPETIAPLAPNIVHRLKRLKWFLPITLSLLVIIIEVTEHAHHELTLFSDFGMEILVFALSGPIALAILLNWLQQAVALQEQTTAQLRVTFEEVVAAQDAIQRLNADLERRVRERTRELEEARDALSRKNEELTALDELKSEFVSLVSHELRSPLTNINGGIELLLRREPDLSQRAKKTLATLSSQSQRLTRLVETILDLSALEAGKLTLSIEPLSVGEIILAQIEACHICRTSSNLQLKVDDALPLILADANCLGNVLSNLLDNAHKYADVGEVVVKATRENGTVRVTVADQGDGIPEEEHQRVFDMFYRLDSSDDREIYGYGLGLHASKRLVEAMSGEIWVESAPGQGAQFHFTLPIAGEDS